jgi:hypothetical protein
MGLRRNTIRLASLNSLRRTLAPGNCREKTSCAEGTSPVAHCASSFVLPSFFLCAQMTCKDGVSS